MITNEQLKELAYQQLAVKEIVRCTKDEFNKHIKTFQTPQGVYIELYQDMNEIEAAHNTNKLLNVTSDDLQGYANACDWLVRQNEKVYFVENLNIYLLADDEIDIYIKL